MFHCLVVAHLCHEISLSLRAGIYHRFSCDENDIIKAMRLFIGQPIWTPFNRPCDEHPSRKKYVEDYVDEKKSSE